jgi:hypothetical protein
MYSPRGEQTRKSTGWGAGGSEFLLHNAVTVFLYNLCHFRTRSNFFAKDEKRPSA